MKLTLPQTDNTKVELKSVLPLNLQYFAEEEEVVEEEEETPDEPKVFTQEEVNKMMAREKRQGKASVFKGLGYTSEKEFTDAMNKFKEFTDSQKTDTEKANEATEIALRAQKEAEQRLMLSEAKVEALKIGVKAEYLDDIMLLAKAKMTEDTTITEVLEEMKTKYPTMFGIEEEKKQTNKGTGKPPSSNKKEENKPQGIGARLATLRMGNQSTK